MVCTAFFEDSGKKYVIRVGGQIGRQAEARDTFWFNVLGLIDWRGDNEATMMRTLRGIDDEEAVRQQAEAIRAMRPTALLDLTWEGDASAKRANVVEIDCDFGPVKARHAWAILASEVTTVAVGSVAAALWRNWCSVWFFAPLLVTIWVLVFCVRRQGTRPPSQEGYGNQRAALSASARNEERTTAFTEVASNELGT